MSPCPGSCNREWRAAEARAQDELANSSAAARPPSAELVHHDVKRTEGDPVWCEECRGWITEALWKIPTLASSLTPGALNVPGDVNAVRTGPLSHSPSPSPAWDLADQLIRWAVESEDDLRSVMGHPDSRPMRNQSVKVKGRDVVVARVPAKRTLGDACRYLSAYVDAAVAHPIGGEAFGRRVLWWRKVLERNTGTDKLVHRLPGVCTECDMRSLMRRDGGNLVTCRGCGASWDWAHYDANMARALAADTSSESVTP